MAESTETIAAAARSVLLCAAPGDKVMRARAVARAWRKGELAHAFDTVMPDEPARPETPELLPPNRMPRRGRIGSERGRIAMLHALAHIEFVAIDLAFDLIGRFGAHFPRDFVDDWIRVGAEEAMHFALLDRRLRSLGSHYGALAAHGGLWESAQDTAHDRAARLAVVPMLLEARGLDVTPATVERFIAVGDERSARILDRIARDEVRHVHFGVKWFESYCFEQDLVPQTHWQLLVRRHFNGQLKAPFNASARRQAGLSRDYYLPLASVEPS